MARGPLNKDSHWSLFSSSRSITAFQSRVLGVGLQCELWRPVLALTQHRGLFPRERERERDTVWVEVVPLLASPRMVSRGVGSRVSGAEGLRPLTRGAATCWKDLS